jgi:hypothetical protein
MGHQHLAARRVTEVGVPAGSPDKGRSHPVVGRRALDGGAEGRVEV